MVNEHYKMISLTALGGALEFYDFTIYALFSPYLSHHFFPPPVNGLRFSIPLLSLP